MNVESAKSMNKRADKSNNIVYRATKKIERPEGKPIPTDLKEYIYDYAGEYTLTKGRHETMDKEYYIHITSPIRRIVDTMNMMTFQLLLYPDMETNLFYEQWFQKIDYINETCKAIKKTQLECELLDLCVNNPYVLEKEYDGIIFGDLVFLKELKLFSRFAKKSLISSAKKSLISADEKSLISSDKKSLMSTNNFGKFKLFLFQDEEFYRKKVRVSQQE
jgi:exoribonuclease R